MTKSERMPKFELRNGPCARQARFDIRASDFFRHSSFIEYGAIRAPLGVGCFSVICLSNFEPGRVPPAAVRSKFDVRCSLPGREGRGEGKRRFDSYRVSHIHGTPL